MEDDPITTPELEEAERRGFYSGLNVGLLVIGIICAVGAAVRSLVELPRFEQVFGQVKVPMPGLTLLVFSLYPVVVTALLLGAVACMVATKVWGNRRRTIVLNAMLLTFSLLWIAGSMLAMHLPYLSVHGGIGPRR